MAKFLVTMTETVEYLIPVEADTADKAEEAAEDVYCNLSPAEAEACFVSVLDRGVAEVEEDEEETTAA